MDKRSLRPSRPLSDRFWEKVQKSDGCWLWTGYRNKKGYGGVTTGSKKDGTKRCSLAHRVAWELAFGLIPDDLGVLHHCDTPACVNPAHLFLGTLADNNADCHQKGRYSHSPRLVGTRNHLAKLSPDAVRSIRAAYTGQHGDFSRLARQFGVNYSTVERVVRGKTWGHVA